MKKIITLLLLLAMLPTTLVGCKNSSSNDEDNNGSSFDADAYIDHIISNGGIGSGSSSSTDNKTEDNTATDDNTENNTATDSETENNTDTEDKDENDALQNLRVEIDGLLFRLMGDHAVLLGRSESTNGIIKESIVIPSHCMGLPVTEIGEKAFIHDRNIKSLTIPDTVTRLGTNCIYDCPYLTELNIPSSIVEYGDCILWGCNALPFVLYNDAAYFGNEDNPYMFLFRYIEYPQQRTTLEIHSDTKYICMNAFARADKLETAVFPEGLIAIDHSAFWECTALKKIVIPDSVAAIYGCAFSECKNLEEVTLGKGIIELGDYVFDWCGEIEKFYFNGTEAEWAVIADSIKWSKKTDLGDPICTDTLVE